MLTTEPTVYVIYIASTPEQVWEALTSPGFSARYFFGRQVESDWAAGSEWRLRKDDGGAQVSGRVLESDPPRLLKLSWQVAWVDELHRLPESIVSYLVEPAGEAVRLTLVEEHPHAIPAKLLEGGRQGWPMIISGLKTLLETGKPLGLEVPSPAAR
jgi:uncharacterized protein YndB with AHSA1/START domain